MSPSATVALLPSSEPSVSQRKRRNSGITGRAGTSRSSTAQRTRRSSRASAESPPGTVWKSAYQKKVQELISIAPRQDGCNVKMKTTDNIRISRNGLKRPSTRTAPRVLTRQGREVTRANAEIKGSVLPLEAKLWI